MTCHTVGSQAFSEYSLPSELGQGGTTVARGLQYGVREGGDGDEICMDADVLFLFLDAQSRSLRDFLRSAGEE